MAGFDDLLKTALTTLPSKAPDSATWDAMRLCSDSMSAKIAFALAEQLRQWGTKEARPSRPRDVGMSGAERRLAGGFGAKPVEVTWTTEESGPLMALNVNTIHFRDGRSNNVQKYLANRPGDMLGEARTLHRRLPCVDVAGFVFLDNDAKSDQAKPRKPTFESAFPRLRIFTGWQDPAARDEQFERRRLLLVDANSFSPSWESNHVRDPTTVVALEAVFDDLVTLAAERNFDFHEADSGKVCRG